MTQTRSLTLAQLLVGRALTLVKRSGATVYGFRRGTVDLPAEPIDWLLRCPNDVVEFWKEMNGLNADIRLNGKAHTLCLPRIISGKRVEYIANDGQKHWGHIGFKEVTGCGPRKEDDFFLDKRREQGKFFWTDEGSGEFFDPGSSVFVLAGDDSAELCLMEIKKAGGHEFYHWSNETGRLTWLQVTSFTELMERAFANNFAEGWWEPASNTPAELFDLSVGATPNGPTRKTLRVVIEPRTGLPGGNENQVVELSVERLLLPDQPVTAETALRAFHTALLETTTYRGPVDLPEGVDHDALPPASLFASPPVVRMVEGSGTNGVYRFQLMIPPGLSAEVASGTWEVSVVGDLSTFSIY